VTQPLNHVSHVETSFEISNLNYDIESEFDVSYDSGDDSDEGGLGEGSSTDSEGVP